MLVIALVVGALFGVGSYLVLQRTLTRIVLGFAVLSHGVNLLLIASGGEAGIPPIIGTGATSSFADPLPQALALTAIVISFAATALLLALAYRSWQHTHDDDVQDDIEDRRIAQLDEVDDGDVA